MITRDAKIEELKDDVIAKIAIVKQAAGTNVIVQKVIGEIEQVMAGIDDPDIVKTILKNIPKDSLALVVDSTGCGNIDHKVTVLNKAMFCKSVDEVRVLENAFSKLTKCMKSVVELCLVSAYFGDGNMNWKQYTKDVFAAK